LDLLFFDRYRVPFNDSFLIKPNGWQLTVVRGNTNVRAGTNAWKSDRTFCGRTPRIMANCVL